MLGALYATDSVVEIHQNATANRAPRAINTMKILIAIPYHARKRYALPHLLDWLEAADLTCAEILMRWHIGEFGGKDAVKKQREFFRLHALEHDFTHLYFMDADTIPPLDTLQRLYSHGKDIAGALYNSRNHGNHLTPLAWRDTPDPHGFLREPEGLHEVDGMGMGAVLFSKQALKQFSFTEYEHNSDDWPVYRILKQKEYPAFVDTSLKCKHYTTEKEFV